MRSCSGWPPTRRRSSSAAGRPHRPGDLRARDPVDPRRGDSQRPAPRRPGRIEVAVRGDADTVELEITNDGVGPAQRGGAGMGLRISAFEALQHGASLTFRPDRARALARPPRPPRPGDRMTERNLRVLVVDDHQVVHWGLRLMLGRLDWVERCIPAATGEQAVEFARRYTHARGPGRPVRRRGVRPRDRRDDPRCLADHAGAAVLRRRTAVGQGGPRRRRTRVHHQGARRHRAGRRRSAASGVGSRSSTTPRRRGWC